MGPATIRVLANHTGMRFLNPNILKVPQTGLLSIKDFKSKFKSSKPCAVMFGMLKSPPFEFTGISAELPKNTQKISSIDQNKLAWAVVNAVNGIPSAIMKAAKEFIRSAFNDELFVGVHWRYEQEFFAAHCQAKENFCRNVFDITPQQVATVIYSELEKFFPKFSRGINLYIASPPSSANFTHDITTNLKQLNSTFRTSTFTLAQFLNERFGNCMKENNWHFGDALSRVEQALMVKSDYFFFSEVSSWSQNCRNARWYTQQDGAAPVAKYEANIFELKRALFPQKIANQLLRLTQSNISSW